jgi:hypothetical protein
LRRIIVPTRTNGHAHFYNRALRDYIKIVLVFSRVKIIPSRHYWTPLWGRAFVKGILNSSRGLHPQDNSPQAQQARRIQGFADLDGIELVAKVEMDKDSLG